MTKFLDFFAALAAPIPREQVKTRQQAGRSLSYITARTVLNRLDEVAGPEGWFDEYIPAEHSVICKLSIRLPDGTWLTKQDAGGFAGMSDQGDDEKSGFSDAMKRAAVKWGIGRELYGDGVAHLYSAEGPTEHAPQRPPMPAASAPPSHSRAPANGQPRQYDGPPRSGKALFAALKDLEQKMDVGIIKYINSWAKLQDWPGRMVDFDAEQVALAYAEAMRKLESIRSAEEIGATGGREPGQEG